MLDNELDELLNSGENETPHAETQEQHKRKSLGRGLGALLGDDDLTADDVLLPTDSSAAHPADTEIFVNQIVAGKYQPRTEFDEEALNALSDSIKEKGILQPLLLRRQGDKYEIIAGERRWRAAQKAGLEKVPAIIKDMSDKEVLEVALVENLLRENLSAIEEAEGFQRLIDEFSHTQEALSQIVGKSRSHVANTLRLLALPDSIKELIKEGKLSAGHARCLIGLENAEELAKAIIQKDLSVRQVEELVARLKDKKDKPEEKKPVKKNEDLETIERDLKKSLGLRIKITPSKQGGGKVVLQYASVAELDMIVDILENKRKNNLNTDNQPQTQIDATPAGSSEKFTIKIID